MPDRKFGRIRPEVLPHHDSGILQFGAVAKVKLRTAPPKVTWWKPNIPRILGNNDKFGTCGPVSYANFLKLCSAYTQASPVVLTSQEILSIYEQLNPNFNPVTGQNDDGVNLSDLYNLMKMLPIRGVLLKDDFAIDPTAVNNIKWGIRIFGPITFGVNLTQSDIDQTDAGQPWTLTNRRLPSIGGHAVTVYDYDDDRAVWEAESWAEKQEISYEWGVQRTEEVRGFIHPYQFAVEGGNSFAGLNEVSMRTDAGLI